MKSIFEYLLSKSNQKLKDNKLDEVTALKIAEDLVQAGNAGHYSFWAETTEDDFTGQFEGVSYDDFEDKLTEYLTNVLMQYNTPIDCEEFTDAIQNAYCGDEAGEADYGYNAHEEILGYVKEVFKKYKIAK